MCALPQGNEVLWVHKHYAQFSAASLLVVPPAGGMLCPIAGSPPRGGAAANAVESPTPQSKEEGSPTKRKIRYVCRPVGGAPGLMMAALPKHTDSHALGDLSVCRCAHNFGLHPRTVFQHSAVQIVLADLRARCKPVTVESGHEILCCIGF